MAKTLHDHITLKYIQDPAHGWLEFPAAAIPDSIRDKISHFSYLGHRPDGEQLCVYLEEDCDMPLLLDWYEEHRGGWPPIEPEYHDITGMPECFVRSLPRYNARLVA